jgi:tetratricopeptide (TPR) repeat protein
MSFGIEPSPIRESIPVAQIVAPASSSPASWNPPPKQPKRRWLLILFVVGLSIFCVVGALGFGVYKFAQLINMETKADFARFAAETHAEEGEYAESAAKYEEVAELRRRQYGEEDERYFDALFDAADAWSTTGENEKASAIYERRYLLMKGKLGAKAEVTLVAHEDWANSLLWSCQYVTAQKELEAIVAIRRSELGLANPQTLIAMEDLAYCRNQMGNCAAALEAFESIYAIRKDRNELDPDEAYGIYFSLTKAMEAVGRFEEVLKLSEERYLTATTNKEYSVASADVVDRLEREFESCLRRTNRMDEVEAIARKRLGRMDKNSTAPTPEKAYAMDSLAEILAEQGKHLEAAELRMASFNCWIEVYAADDQVETDESTASYILGLAARQFRQAGQAEKGLAILKEFCEDQSKKAGPTSTKSLSARLNVGRELIQSGKVDEGRQWVDKCLADAAEALSPEDEWIRGSLWTLIYELDLKRQADQRIAMLQKLLALPNAKYANGEEVSNSMAMQSLAEAYLASGDLQRAISTYESLVERPHKDGASQRELTGYCELMITCLLRDGQHARAMEILSKMRQLPETAADPDEYEDAWPTQQLFFLESSFGDPERACKRIEDSLARPELLQSSSSGLSASVRRIWAQQATKANRLGDSEAILSKAIDASILRQGEWSDLTFELRLALLEFQQQASDHERALQTLNTMSQVAANQSQSKQAQLQLAEARGLVRRSKWNEALLILPKLAEHFRINEVAIGGLTQEFWSEDRTEAQLLLSVVLMKLQQFSEAEKAYMELLGSVSNDFTPASAIIDAAAMRRIVTGLTNLYEACGKPSQVEHWRTVLAQLDAEHPGAERL